MNKPAKPSPDFPLFAHASGVWAKKINGKLHYFAPWHDPQGALRAYQAKFGKHANAGRATALQPPRRRRATTTLQDACNTFLSAQETRKEKGEIASITFAEYLRTSQRLCAHLGKSTPLETLSPGDFASYRSWRAATCNLVSVGNETTRVRTIIKWAWKHFGIPYELNFGPDFRKPSAKALRRHRRLAGKKLFTPRQIRLLLDETGVHLHAMILLGINCGFGNADVATMPVDAVNFDTSWIYYPRPKTEVEREIPLWPETAAALKASHDRRYEPSAEAEGRFFVMYDGKPWNNSNNPICKQFRQAMERAGISRGGFYWLRHTFETIGGGAKDQVAVNAIMGHVDNSMAGNYRHEIDEDRLRDVVNHVRRWLFN